MTYKVGSLIGFEEERCRYTIQAVGARYLVCTRPMFGTVVYTVVDLVEQVRGTENLIFGYGVLTRAKCEEMLARLEGAGAGPADNPWHTQVSHRNRIPLKIKEPK